MKTEDDMTKYVANVSGIQLDEYDLKIVIKALRKRGKKILLKTPRGQKHWRKRALGYDHLNIAHLFTVCLEEARK